MYTGIVQALQPVRSLEKKEGLYTFSIEMPKDLLLGLDLGASVNINGVCFTVTRIAGNEVFFDAIRETLALSNIRLLELGSLVNLERSARQGVEKGAEKGAEIGGHLLSGHVTGTASVLSLDTGENHRRLTFDSDPGWRKFIFEKGFLGVNGASLTIAALDRSTGQFSINLIPETLARTNFPLLQQGDLVNIEVDAQTRSIVETVERIMAERTSGGSD